MSSRESLLVALVATVVGLGAGFLFASVLDSSRPAEASEPTGIVKPPSFPEDASSDAVELLDATPLETARGPAVQPLEELPPRVSEAEFQRALNAVVAPSVGAERGSGSITGEVLDASGAPIQGAVVVSDRLSLNQASDPASVGAGPPPEQSLEDYLREQAQSWAESRGGRRRAVTGPDGRFEFKGLVESASYRLSAYLENHILEAEGSSYSVSPGQKVIFRAQGVHVIPVLLVYEDGRRATEGIVGVERGDRETTYTWSTDSPDLRLTAGRVGVRGYAGMRRSDRWREGVDSTHASEETSLDVVAQAGVPLQLVVKPRCGIRGRVIDEFGAGGGRMMVRLLPVAAGAELDESVLAESDRYAWMSGDRFHFLDLTPGSYAVGLSTYNEVLLAHQVVTVGEGVVEVDLVVPEPDPKSHLVLRAFGPSGNPLHDLDFRWRHRREGGSSSGSIQSRRGPDGAWWLQPKAAFFEPWPGETSYTLTVEHSELGNRETQLEEGQHEVTVHFEEPVTIVVVVAGYAGSGYEGKLQVGLTPVVEGEEDGPWGRMPGLNRRGGDGQFSPDGVARFDGLSPGLWEVSLQIKIERWQTRTVQSVEVQVTSGEKTVPMDLPALYELTVIAPGLSKDSRLRLNPTGEGRQDFFGSSSSAQIDADGRAVFKSLVAGDYVLTGNGVPESVDVTIPCGDVYIDAKEPDCLRVAIGDMEGALYKAGLRAGDLIIGADGREFDSAQSAWELFRGEGEVSLIVLRDGERLELSMPHIPMGADWFARLGGMLTPASRQ